MKKKLVSSIIFLSIIFFVGCQRNYTGNNKDRENLKIEKKEKLKECTITEFYNGIAQKDWRDLSIIQLTDDKITATISHYFLILGKTKGKYKISKIIDLYPYNVDSYYSEESTEFNPSQDTKKYLIYNECYINKKDQVIPAKENENLNSILIDFEKDEVKYLKGNQFENLKKENNISEKYLAKQGKASLQLEKYADKEGYIIGESTKYKGQVLCIMKKVKEESILKNKIFEQRNGKIKCIFEFI